MRTTNQIRQLVFNSGSVKVTARPAEEMERADWAGLRQRLQRVAGVAALRRGVGRQLASPVAGVHPEAGRGAREEPRVRLVLRLPIGRFGPVVLLAGVVAGGGVGGGRGPLLHPLLRSPVPPPLLKLGAARQAAPVSGRSAHFLK